EAQSVFFETDAVALEEAPHRAEAGGELLLCKQAALHFGQRKVGLRGGQRQQPLRMLANALRAAVAAGWLRHGAPGFAELLHPLDGRTGADPNRRAADRIE